MTRLSTVFCHLKIHLYIHTLVSGLTLLNPDDLVEDSWSTFFFWQNRNGLILGFVRHHSTLFLVSGFPTVKQRECYHWNNTCYFGLWNHVYQIWCVIPSVRLSHLARWFRDFLIWCLSSYLSEEPVSNFTKKAILHGKGLAKRRRVIFIS